MVLEASLSGHLGPEHRLPIGKQHSSVFSEIPPVVQDNDDLTKAKLEAVRNALLNLPDKKRSPSEVKPLVDFTDLVKDVSTKSPEQALNDSARDRLIRQTLKLTRKKIGESSIPKLYESTGLTPEMAKEAKKTGRIELLKSGRYFLASESFSTAVGWIAERTNVEEVFDIKNIAILAGTAILGRITTVGMLAWKGNLNERRIEEVDGIATDPLAKWAHENGKGKLGFIATNGTAEAWYALQTATLAVAEDLPSALVFDSAASLSASAKLLGENLYLKKKIKSAREKRKKDMIAQTVYPNGSLST